MTHIELSNNDLEILKAEIIWKRRAFRNDDVVFSEVEAESLVYGLIEARKREQMYRDTLQGIWDTLAEVYSLELGSTVSKNQAMGMAITASRAALKEGR